MVSTKQDEEPKEQKEDLLQQIEEELAKLQARIGPHFRWRGILPLAFRPTGWQEIPFMVMMSFACFCAVLRAQINKGLADVPRVIMTDKLASYAAAKKEIMSSVEHRQHKGLKNRAENSHQPTRQRERTMRRFTSPGHAQRFLSAFGPISDHVRPRRHHLSASDYRALFQERCETWNEITKEKSVAERADPLMLTCHVSLHWSFSRISAFPQTIT
jgi:DDE domain